MQEFPPKVSSVLVSPDPQYIPGYAGYCPQLKYHHGRTYGHLTSELLPCPETLSSRHLLPCPETLSSRHLLPCPETLSSRHLLPCPETLSSRHLLPCPETLSSRHLLHHSGPRDHTWMSRQGEERRGEERSLERLIPGYTGFVPKSQNYFAGTYAETCHQALRDFHREQRSRQLLQTADWPFNADTQQEAKKLTTPLTAVSPDPGLYPAPEPWKSLGSPYFMDDHSPHKYFISGFTGYVPKSRFLIGSSYPITTNKALIQFSRQMRSDPTSLPLSLPPIPPVYPTNRGLLPSYTGHVPGYKFRYGHTFGQLTQNALGLSTTQRKVDVRS